MHGASAPHLTVPEAVAEEGLHGLRVGALAGAAHGLPDEEPEQLLLAGAVARDLLGVLGEGCLDGRGERALVADGRQPAGLDHRLGVAAVGRQDAHNLGGALARDRAVGLEAEDGRERFA
ncbi:MAG: hypothetical protein AAF594_15020 [Bacteroidota bacterium]